MKCEACEKNEAIDPLCPVCRLEEDRTKDTNFQNDPDSCPILLDDGETVVDGLRVNVHGPHFEMWYAQRADGSKTGHYATFGELEAALSEDSVDWNRESTESGKILGVVERSMPSEYTEIDGISVEYSIVMVSGAVGDYAAYVGVGNAGWVKENGTKLDFAEAEIHFPGIVEARYRK